MSTAFDLSLNMNLTKNCTAINREIWKGIWRKIINDEKFTLKGTYCLTFSSMWCGVYWPCKKNPVNSELCISDKGYLTRVTRSRIHDELTVSLRFLDIVLRFLRLEVSAWISEA
jgi:hypothetical protein